MKFLWILIAILFSIICSSAQAQFNGCQAGFCAPPAVPAVVGYQGPGDIASGATAFYSCARAYNAAYATALGAACDVVDTATGLVTCTLNFLSTGFVNKTQCSGVGQSCATACSISKMYNHVSPGTIDVVQATLANMFPLAFNALNSLPCVSGNANTAFKLESAGTISQSAPFTLIAVAERTGSFTTPQRIISNGASSNGIRFAASANTIIAASGGTSVTLTANDSTPHAILQVVSATAPLLAIDSSANTSTSSSGTTALSGNQYFASAATAQPMQAGIACEGGLWPSDQNANYQALLANMRSATNGWNF